MDVVNVINQHKNAREAERKAEAENTIESSNALKMSVGQH